MNGLFELLVENRDEEDFKEIVEFFIETFTKESEEHNNGHKTIGRHLEINPVWELDKEITGPKTTNRWVGYIPNYVRIVYECVNHNGIGSNDGGYYYMGDESYVYDFCKYVRDKKIGKDPIKLIMEVDKFIHNYFDKPLNKKKREIINKLVDGPDGKKLGPVREHYLSDFKGTGAAFCSEYTVMAENLLAIFGLDVEVLFEHNHAFIVYSETKEVVNILDFSRRVKTYDIYLNVKEENAFLEPIPDFTEELYEDILLNGKKIKFPNYYVVETPRTYIITVDYDTVYREYGADGKLPRKKEIVGLEEEKPMVLKKIYTGPESDFDGKPKKLILPPGIGKE